MGSVPGVVRELERVRGLLDGADEKLVRAHATLSRILSAADTAKLRVIVEGR